MITLCIAGKNDIAVNALHYVITKLGYDVNNVIVVTNDNDTGLNGWQKSLRKAALDLNVRICHLEDLYEVENLRFISLEFDKIINVKKFKSKELFNIHFSYLPKYKGMYTSVLPIINGDRTSGVTLHKIDNGIDTGEIIDQREFEVDINDTARDLYFKYLLNGIELFVDNIEGLISGKYCSVKQSVINSSYYSKKYIDFNNIVIDFKKTSYEIHNQIRAFIFKEYQLPKINGLSIKKSVLTNEFIGYNHFEEMNDKFIISGIDGYKIIATKDF